MSEFLIIAFDDRDSAFDLDRQLSWLRRQQKLETQDTTVVTRDEEGGVHMHRPVNVPAAQTAGGAVWGLVLGAAFMVPIAGAAVGAATGALAGQFRDPGVDSDFLKRIAETLKPGGSAVCLWVRDMDTDAVMQVIDAFPEKGYLLQSPLNAEEEERLAMQLKGGEPG